MDTRVGARDVAAQRASERPGAIRHRHLQGMADEAPRTRSHAAIQAKSESSARVTAQAKARASLEARSAIRVGAGGAVAQRVTPSTDLGELATQINQRNVAEWAANTGTCWNILKGPFESNWFKAKECLLMGNWPGGEQPDHQACLKLMDGLVSMRGSLTGMVERMAEAEIQNEVGKEARDVRDENDPLAAIGPTLLEESAVPNERTKENGKEKPGKQVEFKAPVGNQKRTSDIDIATGGINTEIAVALINRLFKQVLGVPFEVGTVFDYNVYSMDWFHNLKPTKENRTREVRGGLTSFFKKKEVTTEVTTEMRPGTEHALEDARDVAERDTILEKASLLKLRRFVDDNEWGTFVARRLGQADPTQVVAMSELFLEVDDQFAEFNRLIEARERRVEEEIDAALGAHESAWGAHDHFKDAAVRTAASNRIYEDRLREVKSLRAQHAELKKGPDTAENTRAMAQIAKSTTRALSEALFFANEVYATEGAMLHAVVGIQTAAKKNKEQAALGVKVSVPLSRARWVQSFNENAGDVLKDLDHYKNNPPFAVYRAGKYMDRMCLAAPHVKPDVADLDVFPELSRIAATHVRVKASDAGDDPLESAKAFASYDADGLAALRSKVLLFAADVGSAQAEEKAAPQAEQQPDAAPAPAVDDVVAAPPAREEPPQIAVARAATARLADLVAAGPPA